MQVLMFMPFAQPYWIWLNQLRFLRWHRAMSPSHKTLRGLANATPSDHQPWFSTVSRT